MTGSDDANFRCDGDGLVFRSKANEGFLLSIGSNQRVDGFRDNSEDILEGSLDLNLVGSVVGNEGEGIALGHGLVSLLSVEGLHEDGVFIEFSGELEGGS